MKNRIEYFLFLLFSLTFGLLGLKTARKLASLLTFIFYYIIPIRKKTVIENLTNAFPEYDVKKIRNIAYNTYKSFLTAFIEILYLKKISRQELEAAVNCPNKDLIETKFKEDKGVILLSAHFGNWEYVAASVALQLNLPFSVVVKPQRNHYVSDWMNNVRTRWNNDIVSLGLSIRKTYQTLKEKKIVAMVADQRGPQESIKINFFGRKVSVHVGPAVLALKTGAPILCGIPLRQKDFSYKLVMHEISKDNLPEDNEEKIIELSQRHTAYLESFIRKHPEQWLWMHKRWKH
ncbi:MAG: lysophospholipid acyltransferase family protein [Ignavibacteriaceae bacterium]|nr:lysophospholipid acyltransferase family protein [Ignavibacteriaceae bacterium]